MATIVIEMPDFFTPAEAAKLIGVGPATLYRWLKKGYVFPVEVDHHMLVPRSEILKVLIKKCSTCYHFQEFGHCSCRMAEDVETRPGMCHDWHLVDNLKQRS